MTVNTTPQIIVTRGRLHRCLAVIAAGTFCFAGSSRALGGDAKGTLNFKGTTLVLKFAYLVKGPDAVDPNLKIRRLVFSATDLGPKLKACTKMSCTDGAVTEGMTVDLTGGPRINYWVALKGGRVQVLRHGRAISFENQNRRTGEARRDPHD